MMTQPAAPSKTRKSQYRPHIRKVAEGAYTCQSERYTYVLYLVTVHDNGATSCECDAGQHGRNCKHQRAVVAYMAYRAHPTHLQAATPRYNGAQGLMEAFGL
jgi:hypothetical protein